MAKEKSRMPMTTAGLINYSDEVEGGINLRPEIVIAVGFAVCIGLIAIRFVL
ncbi:MAG: preprotein translocase subunit Sec61beta [Candidatus Aenigmatarchaeota archaeon]